jgi:integrase
MHGEPRAYENGRVKMTKRAGRDGVFQRTDTKGWYVSFVDGTGTRRRRRVVAHTRTQAVDVLVALKTKAQTEAILGVKHTTDLSIKDLLARFERYQKGRLRPTTFARLHGILETLIANLPTQLKDVTKAKVADYVSARSLLVSPATVHKEVGTLKHALRLAVEWELIPANPAERARLPRLPQGRTRYLTPPELRSTLEVADEWMRAPIALAAFTGMRRSELLSLRWKDVDLAGRLIYMRDTKNGSLRVIAINQIALNVLLSLSRGGLSDLVFAGVDGPKLSVYTKRLFELLKIEGASFHSLRHTAASWLAMEGVDLFAIGQILGHKTPRMTARYAHLAPQYMAGAVAKLDGVFGDVFAGKLGTPTGLILPQTGTKPN